MRSASASNARCGCLSRESGNLDHNRDVDMPHRARARRASRILAHIHDANKFRGERKRNFAEMYSELVYRLLQFVGAESGKLKRQKSSGVSNGW